MEQRAWLLAQVNVAVLRAPIDSPQLAAFVEQLEPVNALADDAQGFVWRLQTEDGDATAIRAFDDDRIIVNMSVWESVEALGEFVFGSGHLDVLRRRREWFEKMATAYVALWWLLSAVLASPTLAVASAAAFRLGGLEDLPVWRRLRKAGWRRALVASNAVGALVDTCVFLPLAGFPVTLASVGGQFLVKAVYLTVAALLVVEGVGRTIRARAPEQFATV